MRTVAPPSADDRLVRFAIGADGDLQALWCAADEWDSRPADLRLTSRRLVRTIPWAAPGFPRVLLLPGDDLLVVGGACVWRPSGPDRNAVLYDKHNQVVAEETWGDDIHRLAVAADDTIWAGYGTMATSASSNGWGGPGPLPPGWQGLVRYEPDGLRPIWHHPPDSPWGAIDDCYALNAADDGVWICYYSDFPIVRITDRGLTGWHNNHVRGARALAVSFPEVALFGGYDADADLLSVGTLTDDRFEVHDRYRLVLPDGTPLDRATVTGRGPTLHTVIGDGWYQLSIADLPRPGSVQGIR